MSKLERAAGADGSYVTTATSQQTRAGKLFFEREFDPLFNLTSFLIWTPQDSLAPSWLELKNLVWKC